MRYYIIAGEASGDLHASHLMSALKKLDREASFRCWGGDLMQAAGGHLVKHYRGLAYMGFLGVLFHLKTILKNLKFCKQDILQYKPDALILVDYPGFNLRIAGFAHRHGIKVVYYISPQVWAWKKSRVHQIRKHVGKMLTILPFEKEFYRQYDYEVEFVGHPLLDMVNLSSKYIGRDDFISQNRLSGRPLIALLPGSRKQEISRMLPVMASQAGNYPDYEFVIAAAPSLDPEYYRQFSGSGNLKAVYNQTHELLKYSTAALVTSGTATLETALFNVPQVVCYKGSTVSFAIARRLVDVKYISLVNLVMDRQVVKELIQNEFTARNLKQELNNILEENNRQRIMSDYKLLKEKLGGEGASERAAEKIMSFIL